MAGILGASQDYDDFDCDNAFQPCVDLATMDKEGVDAALLKNVKGLALGLKKQDTGYRERVAFALTNMDLKEAASMLPGEEFLDLREATKVGRWRCRFAHAHTHTAPHPPPLAQSMAAWYRLLEQFLVLLLEEEPELDRTIQLGGAAAFRILCNAGIAFVKKHPQEFEGVDMVRHFTNSPAPPPHRHTDRHTHPSLLAHPFSLQTDEQQIITVLENKSISQPSHMVTANMTQEECKAAEEAKKAAKLAKSEAAAAAAVSGV